jgi:hypothetical protein
MKDAGCGLSKIDITLLGTRVNRRTNMLKGAVGWGILIVMAAVQSDYASQ